MPDPEGTAVKSPPWTAEKEQRLRALHADGKTRTEMAKALGFADRGAVCGKLNRLGLTGTGPRAQAARIQAARFERQPNGTTSDWTEDLDRRLIELWPDWTISISNLAQELGVPSRSSVSNRARRLIREGKLQPRGRVLTGHRRSSNNNALAYQVKARSKTPVAVASIPPASDPALLGAITIPDLEWAHCRYPLDTEPQSFCGANREMRMTKGTPYLSPYCCNHSARAFQSPR